MDIKRELSLKFCDSNSIFIVTGDGKIERLYTPFKVSCIDGVGRITAGSVVSVDEVAPGNRDELIYLIGEGAYFHKHFRIELNLPGL